MYTENRTSFVGVECFLFSFSGCMTGIMGKNACKLGEW